MDPVSAGASVIAFIDLALASAKFIHNFLSAAKDGPQSVRRLVEDIGQLQIILQRLQELEPHKQDGPFLAALGPQVQRCSEDLKQFRILLGQLDVTTASSRGGKLWKRLKSAASDKDLERIRESIASHISVLNFNLSLLQTTQLQNSSTQSSEILHIVKQLRDNVAQLNEQQSTVRGGSEGRGVDVAQTTATQTALGASIERLAKLVGADNLAIDRDDAEEVKNDLEILLTASLKEQSSLSSHTDSSSIVDTRKDLRLVNSLILSAPLIMVNGKVSAELPSSIPEGTVIDQTRKRKIVEVEGGSLTISTNKRKRRILSQRNKEYSLHKSARDHEDFVAQFLFRPQDSPFMLAISVTQRQLQYGAESRIPVLSINNVLPENSLVFQLAKAGRLADLKALIAEGKASLRDHDPNGWSLLHLCQYLINNGLDVDAVARGFVHGENGFNTEFTPLHLAFTAHRRGPEPGPDSARVLLEAGADPTINTTGWISVMHLIAGFENINRRDILNLITKNSLHYGIFDLRDRWNATPFMRACFQLGFDMDNTTNPEQYISYLSHFLDHGSDILATDDYGRSCLHSLMGFDRPTEVFDWPRIIAYMIKRGADIHATSYAGISVSDFAYRKHCSDCDSGEYFRGDVWDLALEISGHGDKILEFRKKSPRAVKYFSAYTRADFERLWKGREERCPYWNDAVWPDASLSQIEDTSMRGQEVCNCFDMGGCYYVEDDGSSIDGCPGTDSVHESETGTLSEVHWTESEEEDMESLDQDFSTDFRMVDDMHRTHPTQDTIPSPQYQWSYDASATEETSLWSPSPSGVQTDGHLSLGPNSYFGTVLNNELLHDPWNDDPLQWTATQELDSNQGPSWPVEQGGW
ncbi:putative Ankyrin [Seiridium unicorne]|uniref:Ankyrin n=1 Tax=Seiridium unicorne TaxID=138068 RepID=A0ABR2UQQ1_9PEZI